MAIGDLAYKFNVVDADIDEAEAGLIFSQIPEQAAYAKSPAFRSILNRWWMHGIKSLTPEEQRQIRVAQNNALIPRESRFDMNNRQGEEREATEQRDPVGAAQQKGPPPWWVEELMKGMTPVDERDFRWRQSKDGKLYWGTPKRGGFTEEGEYIYPQEGLFRTIADAWGAVDDKLEAFFDVGTAVTNPSRWTANLLSGEPPPGEEPDGITGTPAEQLDRLFRYLHLNYIEKGEMVYGKELDPETGQFKKEPIDEPLRWTINTLKGLVRIGPELAAQLVSNPYEFGRSIIEAPLDETRKVIGAIAHGLLDEDDRDARAFVRAVAGRTPEEALEEIGNNPAATLLAFLMARQAMKSVAAHQMRGAAEKSKISDFVKDKKHTVKKVDESFPDESFPDEVEPVNNILRLGEEFNRLRLGRTGDPPSLGMPTLKQGEVYAVKFTPDGPEFFYDNFKEAADMFDQYAIDGGTYRVAKRSEMPTERQTLGASPRGSVFADQSYYPSDATVLDVLNSEILPGYGFQEAPMPWVRGQALSVEGVDLSQPASQLQWVYPSKKAAKSAGAERPVEYVYGPNSKVIATDGQGGYLVLRDMADVPAHELVKHRARKKVKEDLKKVREQMEGMDPASAKYQELSKKRDELTQEYQNVMQRRSSEEIRSDLKKVYKQIDKAEGKNLDALNQEVKDLEAELYRALKEEVPEPKTKTKKAQAAKPAAKAKTAEPTTTTTVVKPKKTTGKKAKAKKKEAAPKEQPAIKPVEAPEVVITREQKGSVTMSFGTKTGQAPGAMHTALKEQGWHWRPSDGFYRMGKGAAKKMNLHRADGRVKYKEGLAKIAQEELTAQAKARASQQATASKAKAKPAAKEPKKTEPKKQAKQVKAPEITIEKEPRKTVTLRFDTKDGQAPEWMREPLREQGWHWRPSDGFYRMGKGTAKQAGLDRADGRVKYKQGLANLIEEELQKRAGIEKPTGAEPKRKGKRKRETKIDKRPETLTMEEMVDEIIVRNPEYQKIVEDLVAGRKPDRTTRSLILEEVGKVIARRVGSDDPLVIWEYYKKKYPELGDVDFKMVRGGTPGGSSAVTRTKGDAVRGLGSTEIDLNMAAMKERGYTNNMIAAVLRHEIEHVLDTKKGFTGTLRVAPMYFKPGMSPKQIIAEFKKAERGHFSRSDAFELSYLHRAIVKDALESGKPVPDRVLKETGLTDYAKRLDKLKKKYDKMNEKWSGKTDAQIARAIRYREKKGTREAMEEAGILRIIRDQKAKKKAAAPPPKPKKGQPVDYTLKNESNRMVVRMVDDAGNFVKAWPKLHDRLTDMGFKYHPGKRFYRNTKKFTKTEGNYTKVRRIVENEIEKTTGVRPKTRPVTEKTTKVETPARKGTIRELRQRIYSALPDDPARAGEIAKKVENLRKRHTDMPMDEFIRDFAEPFINEMIADNRLNVDIEKSRPKSKKKTEKAEKKAKTSLEQAPGTKLSTTKKTRRVVSEPEPGVETTTYKPEEPSVERGVEDARKSKPRGEPMDNAEYKRLKDAVDKATEEIAEIDAEIKGWREDPKSKYTTDQRLKIERASSTSKAEKYARDIKKKAIGDLQKRKKELQGKAYAMAKRVEQEKMRRQASRGEGNNVVVYTTKDIKTGKAPPKPKFKKRPQQMSIPELEAELWEAFGDKYIEDMKAGARGHAPYAYNSMLQEAVTALRESGKRAVEGEPKPSKLIEQDANEASMAAVAELYKDAHNRYMQETNPVAKEVWKKRRDELEKRLEGYKKMHFADNPDYFKRMRLIRRYDKLVRRMEEAILQGDDVKAVRAERALEPVRQELMDAAMRSQRLSRFEKKAAEADAVRTTERAAEQTSLITSGGREPVVYSLPQNHPAVHMLESITKVEEGGKRFSGWLSKAKEWGRAKVTPMHRLKGDAKTTNFYQQAVETLRPALDALPRAVQWAEREIRYILDPINHASNDYSLLSHKIILDDAIVTARRDPGNVMTIDDVTVTLDDLLEIKPEIDAQVAANPRVIEAYRRHRELMDSIAEDLVRRNLMDPADLRENYMPHITLEHLGEGKSRARRQGFKEKAGPMFLRRRKDSPKPWAGDYLQAHLTTFVEYMQNKIIDDAMLRIGKDYDIGGRLFSGLEPGQMRVEIPDGYTIWYLREGPAKTQGSLPVQELAQQMLDGVIDIMPDHMKIHFEDAVPGAKMYVLPERLAETLSKFKQENFPEVKADAIVTAALKEYILAKNFVKYNRRNFFGDGQRMVFGLSEIFRGGHLKEDFLATLSDLKKYGRGESSYHVDVATRTSTINSGPVFTDIRGQRIKAENLRPLEDIEWLNPKKAFPEALRTVRRNIRGIAEYRENLFRLFALRRVLRRFEQTGKMPEGISNIDGLRERWEKALRDGDKAEARYWQEAAAGKVAREGVGDYGNFTGWEKKWARRRFYPFYAWLKINHTFWPSLAARNWKKGAAYGAMRGLGTAARGLKWVILATAAKELWNNVLFGQYEQQLTDDAKARFHMWMPIYDEDGQPTMWTDPTPLSEFFETFGLNTMPSNARDFLNNRITLVDMMLDQAGELGKGLLNKGVQGLNPMATSIFEATSGQTIYPDVTNTGTSFDNPLIRALDGMDMKEIGGLLKATGLSDGYARPLSNYLNDLISPIDLVALANDRIEINMKPAGVVKFDPDKAAWFMATQRAFEWQDDHGYEFRGAEGPYTKHNRALWRFIMDDDMSAAKKVLDDYAKITGSREFALEKFKAYMLSKDPLSNITAGALNMETAESPRAQYLESLTEQEYIALERTLGLIQEIILRASEL